MISAWAAAFKNNGVRASRLRIFQDGLIGSLDAGVVVVLLVAGTVVIQGDGLPILVLDDLVQFAAGLVPDEVPELDELRRFAGAHGFDPVSEVTYPR